MSVASVRQGERGDVRGDRSLRQARGGASPAVVRARPVRVHEGTSTANVRVGARGDACGECPRQSSRLASGCPWRASVRAREGSFVASIRRGARGDSRHASVGARARVGPRPHRHVRGRPRRMSLWTCEGTSAANVGGEITSAREGRSAASVRARGRPRCASVGASEGVSAAATCCGTREGIFAEIVWTRMGTWAANDRGEMSSVREGTPATGAVGARGDICAEHPLGRTRGTAGHTAVGGQLAQRQSCRRRCPQRHSDRGRSARHVGRPARHPARRCSGGVPQNFRSAVAH